jgi:hypothetical protein
MFSMNGRIACPNGVDKKSAGKSTTLSSLYTPYFEYAEEQLH